MTLEQNIADLTTATTELTQQVLQTKSDADAAKVSAQDSAAAAAASKQSAASHDASASAAQAAAESARDAAQTAESNAVAVVTGGTASLTAEAGKIPIANAEGKIDQNWLDKERLGIEYTPSVQPTLSSDFTHNEHKIVEQYGLEPKTLPQTWDVTRSTTATRVGPTGLIETVPVDTARIDYDPATGECKGLLVEGQRTNLLTYSEQFDNAYWSKTGGSVVANAAVSPDGKTTADKFIPTAATGHHYINASETLAANTPYALSVFVKAAGYGFARLQTGGNKWAANVAANIDLTTGAYEGGSDVEVTSFGGGWYRLSITAVASAEGGGSGILLGPSDSLTGTVTTTGDGTSGIYIWGAQLEAVSTPSSYIPTTSAQVTRAADTVGRTLGSEFNPSEGTLLIKLSDIVVPATNSDYAAIYDISDDTFDNRSYMIRRRSGGFSSYVICGGIQQDDFVNRDLGNIGNIAVTWSKKENKTLTYIDGALFNSGLFSGFLSPMFNFKLGTMPPNTLSNLSVSAAKYIPRFLSESELQELTK